MIFKVLRRVILSILGILVLIALLFIEENWRGKRAWEQCRRDLEAKGEHLDMAFFIPSPVPDEQNFALTPLLKPLLDYTWDPKTWKLIYKNPSPPVKKISEEIADTKALKPNGKGGWHLGKREDLHAWQTYYCESLPEMDHPESPAEDVMMVMGKFDDLYIKLKEDAQSHPLCRFPLAYEDGILMPIPHYLVLQRVESVISLRAVAELDLNRSHDALGDLEFGFRLMDSFRDERLLISNLVRISFIAILIQPIWEGLASHQWTDAELEVIQARLQKINTLEDYAQSMRMKRAAANKYVEDIRADPANALPSTNGNIHDKLVSRIGLCPGWLYQNQVFTNNVIQNQVISLVNVVDQRVNVEQTVQNEDFFEEQRHHFSPYRSFAESFMSVYFSLLKKNAQAQVWLNEAIIACAIERHRLAHGTLPATLDDLHMANLPHDIINGEPLHYRVTGDDYILYSVGWNGVDDGGKIVKKSTGLPDYMQGDWVWSLKPL